MAETRSYSYTLYFGESIEKVAVKEKQDETTEKQNDSMESLAITQNSKTLKIGNKDCNVALNGVKFFRKIYEPGLIEAEVAILCGEDNSGLSLLKAVKEQFFKRLVTLSVETTIVNDGQNTSGSSQQAESTILARNYYVHQVNPRLERNNSGTSIYVKLSIYSLDKLMTIDKYSKAYVAKRLGADILEKEALGFDFGNAPIETDIKSQQNLFYYYSETKIDIDNNVKPEIVPLEFIQPYLVQYNETFHDFMVRTANRCGEFFYFEDGKLILGLPEKGKVKTISNYENVTFQDSSDSPMDIVAFARDGVKDNEKLDGLNAAPIETDNTGYPKDSFPSKLAYNSELFHDDLIFPMKKDNFTDFMTELGINIGDLAVDVMKRITTNEEGYMGVPEMLRSFAFDVANANLDALKNLREKNKDGNEAYISSEASQQNDDTTTVHFGTLDKAGWTTLKFYSEVHKHQKAQQKNMICIDMGANMLPVKLGEEIMVDGFAESYIVVQVRILSNIDWKRNYGHYGQVDSQTDIYSGKQSQVIYAIPTYHNHQNVKKAVPPVISAPLVRKSGPQTAFVVDNGDPKKQGRVRIVFPWQSVNDSKRLAMYKAEDAKKRLKELVDRANEEIERLQGELKKWQEKNKSVEALSGASAEEKRTMEADIKTRLNVIDNRIEELTQKGEGGQRLTSGHIASSLTANKKKVYTDSEYKKLISDQTEKEELETEKEQLEERLSLLISFTSEDENRILSRKDNSIKKLKDAFENAKSKLNDALEKARKKKEDAEKKLEAAKKEVEESMEKWSDEVKTVASPWIRQATPMATDGGGVFFMPNEGDEVLVNFDNDNIERPYVVGCVYSKNLNEPNTDHKGAITMQSPSGQYISITKTRGGKFVESIAPVLKPIDKLIPQVKDALKEVDSDLAGGIVLSDRYGMFKIDMSSHGRKIDIESPFGKVGISAFTGITINAPNGDINIRGKNVSIEAGNNLTLKSGTNVNYNDVTWKKMGLETVKNAGKGFIDTMADFVELSPFVSMKLVDFALLRCVIDTFLKPVEGTLCVKSNNYLVLEAGKGKAQIPLERHSTNWQEFKKMEKDGDKQIFFAKTAAFISRIDNKISQFNKDYIELKKEAFKQKEAYDKALSFFWDPSKAEPGVLNAVYSLKDYEFKDNDPKQWTGGTIDVKLFKDDKTYKTKPATGYKTKDGGLLKTEDDIKKYIVPKAESYAKAALQLQKKAYQFINLFSDETIKAVNQSTIGITSDKDSEWIDKVFKEVVDSKANEAMGKWEDRYGKKGANPKAEFMKAGDLKSKDDPFTDVLILKRKMVALFLAKLYENTANSAKTGISGRFININYKEADLTDEFLKNKWDNVLALGGKKLPGVLTKAASFAKVYAEFMGINRAWKPIINLDAPRLGWAQKVWNEDTPGQIIFSNSKDATYNLGGENIEKYNLGSMTNEDTLKKVLSEVAKG